MKVNLHWKYCEKLKTLAEEVFGIIRYLIVKNRESRNVSVSNKVLKQDVENYLNASC